MAQVTVLVEQGSSARFELGDGYWWETVLLEVVDGFKVAWAHDSDDPGVWTRVEVP